MKFLASIVAALALCSSPVFAQTPASATAEDTATSAEIGNRQRDNRREEESRGGKREGKRGHKHHGKQGKKDHGKKGHGKKHRGKHGKKHRGNRGGRNR